MTRPMWEWPVYAAATSAILWSGSRLSLQADALAARWGWTRNWAGLILLATVTSLPELVTGLSAVTGAQAPRIALGDLAGSLLFNMLILGVVAAAGKLPFGPRAEGASRYAMLMGFLALAMFVAGPHLGDLASWPLLLLPMLYLWSMRRLHKARLAPAEPLPGSGSLRAFGFHGGVVVVSAIALPFAAVGIADALGLGRTFVGGSFVAASTSLPEVVVTLAALRMGAPELAVGNLLGSNLMDVAILGVDEMAYPAALLAEVDTSQLWLTGTACAMMALVWIAVRWRTAQRALGASLVFLYLVGQGAAWAYA